MISLASHPLAAQSVIAVVLLWGCLASLLPYLRRHQRMTGLWLIVALGVPVLGGITLVLGPFLGLVAFGLGVGILVRSPLTLIWRQGVRRQSRRRGGTRPPVSPAE